MTVTQHAQVEVRAVRMLRAGDSLKEVSQATGLSADEIAVLQRDTPGAKAPAPTPRAPQGPPTRLPVRLLLEHPANVRTDLGDLEEMKASVLSQGILQPLLVTPGEHGRFVVIAGHRRLAAAAAVGLDVVPVLVRTQLTDVAAIEAMLVENLQRSGLHPLDEANGYQQLVESGLNQADIARRVGKGVPHVSARLALLNLTPAEQAAMRRGELGVHEAYLAGRDRSPRKQKHSPSKIKPRKVPHFTVQHPLAEAAGARCEHETTLKLGIACGPCWEQAIRDDERRRLGAA